MFGQSAFLTHALTLLPQFFLRQIVLILTLHACENTRILATLFSSGELEMCSKLVIVTHAEGRDHHRAHESLQSFFYIILMHTKDVSDILRTRRCTGGQVNVR